MHTFEIANHSTPLRTSTLSSRAFRIRARRWLVPTAVLAAALISPAARAQSTDPAAARALFSEARQLATQKKFDQACPKFEESLRLDYGVGTLFNLADCWEKLGKTASAWARFLDASAGARAAGQADRERVARERAAALEPKLSRLTIEVKKPETGLEIKRDSQPVGRAAWGTAVPVDPGAHLVEATAPGKKAWTTRVEVPAKAATIAVAVAPLEDNPEATQAAVPVPPTTPGPAGTETGPGKLSETPESSSDGSWNTQKTVGVALAGVGVVGIAVGTAFALMAKSKTDESLGICPDTPMMCGLDEIARQTGLKDEASSNRTVSYVGFATGGAALIAGAAVFFTAPSRSSSAVTVGPMVGTGSMGAVLAGRF